MEQTSQWTRPRIKLSQEERDSRRRFVSGGTTVVIFTMDPADGRQNRARSWERDFGGCLRVGAAAKRMGGWAVALARSKALMWSQGQSECRKDHTRLADSKGWNDLSELDDEFPSLVGFATLSSRSEWNNR